MSRFLSEKFRTLKAYVPGEQPRDKKYIKLNTNESPYPPSPAVQQALLSADMGDLRLYTDPTAKALTDAIAEVKGLTTEHICVSGGSDEALSYAFMAFAAGGRAWFPDITYGFYEVYCDLFETEAVKVPLREDWSVAPEDYFGAKGLIAIANPNAPTGKAMSTEDIVSICEHAPESVVLIDEAYADFAGESVLPLVEKYPNLLVIQTFSKSRCLAGARIAFAAGSPEIIEDIKLIKFSQDPFDLDRLALIAGEAAMRDTEYLAQCVRKNAQARDWVTGELRALGFEVLDSKANFVMASPKVMGGAEFLRRLRERGILVRFFPGARTDGFVRITIGTMDEMRALISAAREIMTEAEK